MLFKITVVEIDLDIFLDVTCLRVLREVVFKSGGTRPEQSLL